MSEFIRGSPCRKDRGCGLPFRKATRGQFQTLTTSPDHVIMAFESSVTD